MNPIPRHIIQNGMKREATGRVCCLPIWRCWQRRRWQKLRRNHLDPSWCHPLPFALVRPIDSMKYFLQAPLVFHSTHQFSSFSSCPRPPHPLQAQKKHLSWQLPWSDAAFPTGRGSNPLRPRNSLPGGWCSLLSYQTGNWCKTQTCIFHSSINPLYNRGQTSVKWDDRDSNPNSLPDGWCSAGRPAVGQIHLGLGPKMCCNNRLTAWHQESSLELTYLGHLSSPPTTLTRYFQVALWLPQLGHQVGCRKNRGQRRIENPGRATGGDNGCEYACHDRGGCRVGNISNKYQHLLTLSLANEQVEWVGNPRAGPSKGYCTSQGRSVATF